MDIEQIKAHIRAFYTALYRQGRTCPERLPVRSGKGLAEALGYPVPLLAAIPEHCWNLFAACGNPLSCVRPKHGARILNLGCGVGIDSCAVIKAQAGLVEVVGVDIVFAILRKAQELAAIAALPPASAHWVCANGTALPFSDGSFDGVLMNGVFNLFPDKPELLAEIRRALKTDGQLVIADLCKMDPLDDYFAKELDAWAWCLSGAESITGLELVLLDAGFDRIEISVDEMGDMFGRVVISSYRALS